MARIKFYNEETGKWEYADKALSQGGGGVVNSPELLLDLTVENVKSISQEVDFKGHNNFTIVFIGKKGEAAISVNDATLYLDGNGWVFAYYTSFLDATMESYPKGAIIHHIIKLDDDTCLVGYTKDVTAMMTNSSTFQGRSNSANLHTSLLKRRSTSTKNNAIEVYFSAIVESVTVRIYGF